MKTVRNLTCSMMLFDKPNFVVTFSCEHISLDGNLSDVEEPFQLFPPVLYSL